METDFSSFFFKVGELENLIIDPDSYLFDCTELPINLIDLWREEIKVLIDNKCLLLVEKLKIFRKECLQSNKSDEMFNLKEKYQHSLENFKILLDQYNLNKQHLFPNYNSNLKVIVRQIENTIRSYKQNLIKENTFQKFKFDDVKLAIENLKIVDNTLYG